MFIKKRCIPFATKFKIKKVRKLNIQYGDIHIKQHSKVKYLRCVFVCLFVFFHFYFFSPLLYNHTTSNQLYYKYLPNLQRLHAKYAQSAKTTELNLRNTARKTLDKNAMLALSPKPNTFVCWLGNDNNKESIRRCEKIKYCIESKAELQRQETGRRP